MKSTEFIVEGDDRSPEDVKENHPEVYDFVNSVTGHLAWRQARVETFDMMDIHHVIIKFQPSAGIRNTAAVMKSRGIKHRVRKLPGDKIEISGMLGDIAWEVSDSGPMGNLIETWRFKLPKGE